MTVPDGAPTSVLSRPLLPASLAIFTLIGLSAFESLGVAAALPEIAADLGDVELLPWVLTSFIVVAGVATVASGALIDALGVRSVFRVAVGAFIAGSVLAGVAPSMPVLIAGRVVQGIGAGAVTAVGLAAVTIIYPRHLVGRAFAANSTVWGVMGVAGPGLAAFLLTVASWEWIFLVNVPLGLLALAVGWRVMPGPVDRDTRLRIDRTGLALVLFFNLSLLLAVDRFGWASLGFGGFAVVLGWWYLRHELRVDQPVLMRRHLLAAPLGPLAWTVALLLTGGIAVQAFFTVYVRGARGASETVTAWSVFFFVIGWTIGSNVSSRLGARMAETSVMMIGWATGVGGVIGVLVTVTRDAPLGFVFLAMLAVGVGMGLATNAALTLLQSVTDPAEAGRATAAHQFYRNLAFALGSAAGGAALLLVVGRRVGDVEVVRSLLAGTEADPKAAGAIADGFAASAVAGLVAMLAGAAPLAFLRRGLAPARRVATEERIRGRYGP